MGLGAVVGKSLVAVGEESGGVLQVTLRGSLTPNMHREDDIGLIEFESLEIHIPAGRE